VTCGQSLPCQFFVRASLERTNKAFKTGGSCRALGDTEGHDDGRHLLQIDTNLSTSPGAALERFLTSRTSPTPPGLILDAVLGDDLPAFLCEISVISARAGAHEDSEEPSFASPAST